MTRWLALTALVIVAPGWAAGQQPISKSMAECAVIHYELADLAEWRGRDEAEISEVRDVGDRFFAAAERHASEEGIADPAAHVDRLCAPLSEKWAGRFSRITAIRENKDWIDYCRALGRDRGILPVRN